MKAIKFISIFIFSMYFVVAKNEVSEDDLMKKYCKSEANIVDLEKCAQILPKEVETAAIKCLEDMKKGNTFKDFWKTYCDLSTRSQLEECRSNKTDLEALNKKYNQAEINLNYTGCLDKVWDKKV